MERYTTQNGITTEETIHDFPFVSLILPFNPKMTPKQEITESIGRAVQKITSQLNGNYSGVMVELVLEKLQSALSSLNYSTHKNSIAMYISPVFEKVLYLDIDVEENVTVDHDFAIRDVVSSKPAVQKILLVALSDQRIRIYLAGPASLTSVVSRQIEVQDYCERIRQIDYTLDVLMPAYHLPVMVAGSSVQCMTFLKHTRHSGKILEYITTASREPDNVELQRLVKPFLTNITVLQTREISKHLVHAQHDKRLTTGIDNIAGKGSDYHGSLLLVERGYTHTNGVPGNARSKPKRFSPVKDTVDDVIEKALINGGDVAFVDTGVLPYNEHIALISHLH